MSFNIEKTFQQLNRAGNYACQQIEKTESGESWVVIKPITLLGQRHEVEINVTIHHTDNLITFLMPMYGNGAEGLKGEKIAVFDSILHELNSRTNGGFFTKYTSDETYALVFMHHLPLSRMTASLFTDTIDYFINAFVAFRPLLDSMISKLGLQFDERAGVYDEGRRYLMEYSDTYKRLLEGQQ